MKRWSDLSHQTCRFQVIEPPIEPCPSEEPHESHLWIKADAARDLPGGAS